MNHKQQQKTNGTNPCTDTLTDLEYLEHMIPHHQVAIDMSELLIPHTTNPNIYLVALGQMKKIRRR